MVRLKQVLAFVLTWGMLIATSPAGANAISGMQEAPPANVPAADIDAIVAPIALYPDALVAQILAAATYPDQITEADKWVKSNASLKGDALVQAVNKQPWDPSVKALTEFPSVLDNMANNLSWTSALGDVSYNQQADVMAAIQRLRKQAKDAGNLKTTSQMTVVQQSPQTIVIQPANPQVVYVPTYNPTVVYGTPYYPPGYSTGAVVATGLISFGVGMAVGAAINNSWGWNSWGCGWHGGSVTYNRNVYVSRSNVYANGNRYNYNNGRYNNGNRYNNVNNSGNRNTNISGNTVNVNGGNRNNVNSGNRNNVNNANSGNRTNNANRGNNAGYGTNRAGNTNANRPANNNASRPNASTRPAASADRGYGQKPATGTKSGALSGYGSGGQARAQSNRGQASMGAKQGGGQRSAPAARSGGGGGRKR
jgi:Protein of unknown function (DUF3300)